MDLSKLPRLSETPKPPEPDVPPPPASGALPHEAGQPRSGLLEAWLSIGVGVILLLLVPLTLQYFSSKLFHTKFAPFGDPDNPPPAKVDYIQYTDGSRIYYRNLLQFWSDLAITAFALVLILDGILMLRFRKLSLVLFAFCLTVAATLGNLAYVVITFSSNGLALLSAMAVLFGGYIAMTQWVLLSNMLRARSGSRI